jgi:AmmeMemoRadiSam system protein A
MMENIPSTLNEEESGILLRLARETLELVGRGESLDPIDLQALPPSLRSPGASFVTLMLGSALRGCVGTLERRMPLAEDVRQHTLAAARYDYRFPPVTLSELRGIRIEISVLGEPKPLESRRPEEILTELRPGVDGVIVTRGLKRATFLPQVWERIPSPESFLERLCVKAGLGPRAWREGQTRLATYQVQHFKEVDREREA